MEFALVADEPEGGGAGVEGPIVERGECGLCGGGFEGAPVFGEIFGEFFELGEACGAGEGDGGAADGALDGVAGGVHFDGGVDFSRHEDVLGGEGGGEGVEVEVCAGEPCDPAVVRAEGEGEAGGEVAAVGMAAEAGVDAFAVEGGGEPEVTGVEVAPFDGGEVELLDEVAGGCFWWVGEAEAAAEVFEFELQFGEDEAAWGDFEGGFEAEGGEVGESDVVCGGVEAEGEADGSGAFSAEDDFAEVGAEFVDGPVVVGRGVVGVSRAGFGGLGVGGGGGVRGEGGCGEACHFFHVEEEVLGEVDGGADESEALDLGVGEALEGEFGEDAVDGEDADEGVEWGEELDACELDFLGSGAESGEGGGEGEVVESGGEGGSDFWADAGCAGGEGCFESGESEAADTPRRRGDGVWGGGAWLGGLQEGAELVGEPKGAAADFEGREEAGLEELVGVEVECGEVEPEEGAWGIAGC